MNEINIGEIIRQRRIELNLTQEELCEGICEPCTMSRIETGHQTPTRSKLDALMQRLGLPGKKYYALMSSKELEIEELKTKIVAANVRKNYDESYSLIEKMERLLDSDDQVNRQFISRTRITCGRKINGEWLPYSLEEQLSMLMDTIRITVPSFDVEEINKNLYSLEEIKIINHIASVLSKSERIDEAIDIYYQLMKYVNKRGRILSDSIVMSPFIAHNYSRLLCQNERPKDAIKVAEIGINDCILYGRMECLPGLLYFLAKAYQLMGDTHNAKEKFLESYYTYRAINDLENAELVKEHLSETMDIKV